MRVGALLVVGLFVSLLIATPAQAHDIVLRLPEQAFVGHPIHGAITVPDGESGFKTHQELAVRIAQDGIVQFETDSLHEHDGFHTFSFTPQRAGELEIFADHSRWHQHPTTGDNPGDSATGDDMAIGAKISLTVENPPVPENWSVAAYDPHPSFLHKPGITTLSTFQHMAYDALVDLVGPDGRLLRSYWPANSHVAHIPNSPWMTDAFIRTTVTGSAVKPMPFITRTLEDPVVVEDARSFYGPYIETAPSCAASELLVDPNSIQEEFLAWQADTDVRVVSPLLVNSGVSFTDAMSYRLRATMPQSPEAASSFPSTAAGPLAPFAFRTPGPGAYTLDASVRGSDVACTLEFLILPNTDMDGPGTVRADFEQRARDAMRITLTPERDGSLLPHYEFDTRVVLLDTQDRSGRLVWMGKLHGHEGPVTFDVGDLAPGTYEVQTFPSPQDQGIPAVVTDDPRGFVHPFVIEPPPEPAPTEDTTAATPGPPLALLLSLLALLGAASRVSRRLQG